LQYFLPNLIVGIITRDSIRNALRNGITAEQVIKFLEQNAHPQMRVAAEQRGYVVPPTVSDQIRLWETERNRLSYETAVMYDTFPTINAFKMVEKYTKEISVYLYSATTPQPILIIKADAHDNVRAFIKKKI